MNAGIYCIMNKVNDKMYLGSSTNIKKRWVEHRSALRSRRHANLHLQSAWDKYGEENFEFRIIAYTDDDEAVLLEDHLLKNYPDMFEYNIARDATLPMRGRKHSEETKQKMSGAKSGENNYWFGKHHSDESKQKISEVRTGTHHSEETRAKMSEAKRGETKRGENSPSFGKHPTNESRKKMSEAHIGKHHTDETRRKISEARKLYWASQKESESEERNNMTKPNKTVLVSFRMTEDDLQNLEYLRRRDEPRSMTLRRIIYDAWYEAAKAQDEEAGHPSISDRWNCL